MELRLFIGTRVNGTHAAMILSAAGEALANTAWRIAPATQWHVTALFIGACDEGQLPAMKRHLKRISKGTPRITLNNGRLITMPEHEPRMLWVRFDPHPDLTALHMTLATALNAEPSKHLPYLPHITLARSSKGPEPLKGTIILPSLRLDHLTLFSSQLDPAGSIHTPLATWPLN